jgi:hypothetical protein
VLRTAVHARYGRACALRVPPKARVRAARATTARARSEVDPILWTTNGLFLSTLLPVFHPELAGNVDRMNLHR